MYKFINGVKDLQHQLEKQNSAIEEIKKLIKQYGKYDDQKFTRGFQMWTADFNKLLQILEDKEVRGNMKNWYAIYKGDTFLCQGTKEECAKYLNVKPETIIFMGTPTHLKRCANSKGNNYLISIKVEDIDDDEYILVDNQNQSMI